MDQLELIQIKKVASKPDATIGKYWKTRRWSNEQVSNCGDVTHT